MRAANLELAGPVFAITREWDEQQRTYRFDAGAAFEGTAPDLPAGGEVQLGKLEPGPVLQIRNVGAYTTLHGVYPLALTLMKAYGLKRRGDSREVYVSDPAETPPEQIVTLIEFPVE
jgi:effector-binding domain-containing protein